MSASHSQHQIQLTWTLRGTDGRVISMSRQMNRAVVWINACQGDETGFHRTMNVSQSRADHGQRSGKAGHRILNPRQRSSNASHRTANEGQRTANGLQRIVNVRQVGSKNTRSAENNYDYRPFPFSVLLRDLGSLSYH